MINKLKVSNAPILYKVKGVHHEGAHLNKLGVKNVADLSSPVVYIATAAASV